MVYLFLNCDEFLAARRIAELKAALGEPEMADLNTTELAATQTGVGDLLARASMMPFLTERRLILVEGFLAQLDKRMAASKSLESDAYVDALRLLDGLGSAPVSCDLVFVEEQGVDRRRHLWKGFARPGAGGEKASGLETLVGQGAIVLEEQGAPDAKALPAWLLQWAKTKQIDVQPRAVRVLSDYVGSNLRQLDNELEKLAVYASGRPITEQDVKLLVSDASEALIWNLTDALSQRNGRNAMHALYELRRNDANPFYLLTMMTRQVRIMIKAKDASGQRGAVNEYDIAKRIGESPYPTKKAIQQARNYSEEELDAIMNRLLEADFAMKTGADPVTEIDVLVAELTQRRA
ncbi:MAG: DNA polymerase III subunit delta [Caldilineaceae bacterium]|nr:DNA polymerase III subunit delta [Caldilineaceae bacterium]